MKYNQLNWEIQNSERFRDINDEDIDSEIPEHDLRFTDYIGYVNNFEDLVKKLEIVQFWGFDEIPDPIMNYINYDKVGFCINCVNNINNINVIDILRVIISTIKPNSILEIYHLYRLIYTFKVNDNEIINYIINNKECLYLFYPEFSSFAKTMRNLTCLLDGIRGPFLENNISDYDNYVFLYVRGLYPLYYDLKYSWEVSDKLPKLIEDNRMWKNLRIYFNFSYENKFNNISDKNRITIFELFLNTCLEGSRYVKDESYEYNISIDSIIKTFLDNDYEYNPDFLFVQPIIENSIDDNILDIMGHALIVKTLIMYDDIIILKKLESISWDDINPSYYEDYRDNLHISEEDKDIWHLRIMKYYVNI
jgi:hypothetical protein